MFILQAAVIWFLLRNVYFTEGKGPHFTTLGCPSEFTHAESSGSPYCYGVLKHKITRQFAEFSCGQYAKNSTAVMIPSQQEHEVIRAHLVEIAKKMDSEEYSVCSTKHGMLLWTQGKRKDDSCSKQFVWSFNHGPEIAMDYESWRPNQPDCEKGVEKCVELRADSEGNWNDIPCDTELCALCQVARIPVHHSQDPPRPHSAMSIAVPTEVTVPPYKKSATNKGTI